jgi:hypothetical protein
VVNTSPESYYFIGVRERLGRAGRWLDFKLTTSPIFDPEWGKDAFFGAYKGRNSVRESYQTLLRLLWTSQQSQPPPEEAGARFEFPSSLTRRKVPYAYSLRLAGAATDAEARELATWIRRFLRGTSDALLPRLTSKLLENPAIPPFYYRAIQEDLERLQGFYSFGPGRNRSIRRELGIVEPLIPQERIDDYLVMYKAKRSLRF